MPSAKGSAGESYQNTKRKGVSDMPSGKGSTGGKEDCQQPIEIDLATGREKEKKDS